MVTFQPFGLQLFAHEQKNILLLGYGLVTFIVLFFDMYILQWIIPKLFNEEKWFILSEMVYQVWIVLSISLGNYLYSTMFHITRWRGMEGMLIFTSFTIAIAVIPIVGIIVFSHYYLLRKNLKGADELTQLIQKKENHAKEGNRIILESENKNQSVITTSFQLLCVESQGNYVNTWCLEDGRIVHRVLRNTMKNIEDQLDGANGLFRCHRAYIINLRYIEKAEGNSQGFQLKVRHLSKKVPVARNYTKQFNQAFRNWR
jgi:hypothetical protein